MKFTKIILSLFLFSIIASCNDDDDAKPAHFLGEIYQGGVIFHLYTDDKGKEHGLVVALNDQGTEEPWSNITTSFADATSTWDGASNTDVIISQVGHTVSAASLCKSLNDGGYNDWYLPSVQELNILWNNLYNVNKTLSITDGATEVGNGIYWSSTEHSGSFAWNFHFTSGGSTNTFAVKTYLLPVRAIRAF